MRIKTFLLAVALLMTPATWAAPDDFYKHGPDSQEQPNVPKGALSEPKTLSSKIYPNTTRNYWVYTPAQYDKSKPACLMVFQDGHAFHSPKGDYRIPVVFDNLIHRREMPVTIAVFINPGHGPDQPEASGKDWGDGTTNRRVEYNALDDKYSKLIVDELLPELKKSYNISDNPEHRGIGGASSGAICAWTVAWHRPDQFRKVVSVIGSYTNIMGGHAWPDIIRKEPSRPIRVFIQDGTNDNRGVRRGGAYDAKWDWYAQNVKMVQALTEKKYDMTYVFGIGAHNGKHGGAIMPEMLRWIWRDHAKGQDPMDPAIKAPLGPQSQAK